MNPRRLAWTVSGAATVVWFVCVLVTDNLSRVFDHWESSLTMLLGSFLSGASPLGGGAVSFPVFTKVLDVPGPIARTFGLSIQAVGMTMAVIAILLNKRAVESKALKVAVPAAVSGFLVGVWALGEPDHLFWPPSFGSGWVKATFSIVLATTAVMMLRHFRAGAPSRPLVWNRDLVVALAFAAFAGGALASVAGTGANILVFLVLVVAAGGDPRRALPTSVIVMAVVSIVGVFVLGIGDGQLNIEVAGEIVTSIGGQAVELEAARYDLLGLWLAAVPIVVWGAPLGSWAAARVRPSTLVRFVGVLAAIEVATTLVLVDELRSNGAMMTYMAVGLVALPMALAALERHFSRGSQVGFRSPS
jgi:uncharacterized protein